MKRQMRSGNITAVIDASNVARDESLPGCGSACWDRVQAVEHAWREQAEPEGEVLLVADTSLTNHLGPHCRETYARSKRAQEVLVHDLADTEILGIAEITGAAVISRDYYRDHRPEFPWVQGNTDQFFEWAIVDGHVVLRPRDMGIASEFTVSRRQEEGEYKGSGIDLRSGRGQEIARHRYRCTNPACFLHRFSPDLLLATPRGEPSGGVVCPNCGETVDDLGVGERLVQIKLQGAEGQTARITMAPGHPVVVGREGDVAQEVSRLLGSSANKVSRRHAQLDWDGSNLTVADLGSTNGTFLEQWSSQTRTHLAPKRLTGTAQVRDRDRIRIGSGLSITRSGRRYFRDPVSPLGSGVDTARTIVPSEDPRQ